MRFSISGKLCLLSTGLNIALTSSPQLKSPPPKGRAEFVPAVPPWFPDANRDALSGARLWLRQTNQQPLGALDLSPEGHFPHARRSEAAYAPAFANGGFRPSLLAPRPGDLKVAPTWPMDVWSAARAGFWGAGSVSPCTVRD